ncbi:MAG: dihydrofolate reductase family protein [Verrucomicrobia bacterium]|nr:dihydrofolate reductase family protein [Verrucomicrobiota bacterium]
MAIIASDSQKHSGPIFSPIKLNLAQYETLGKTFGLKTLLLEGGGRINGAFLKEGLIDEISLLVYPGIDGLAGVPSIFEFIGRLDQQPAAGQSLRHIGTETLKGGTVWLRYRVEKEVSP